MDLTACPECEAPAHLEWREVIASTDGPVEHARVRCVQRHVFLLPVDRLAHPAPPTVLAGRFSGPRGS